MRFSKNSSSTDEQMQSIQQPFVVSSSQKKKKILLKPFKAYVPPEQETDEDYLSGTCTTMCPEEEITKVIRIGEVVPLEKDHFTFNEVVYRHPTHPEWTTRDMAIKRFHRSAADNELNVPELVRSPKTLHKTWEFMKIYLLDHDKVKDGRAKNSRAEGMYLSEESDASRNGKHCS